MSGRRPHLAPAAPGPGGPATAPAAGQGALASLLPPDLTGQTVLDVGCGTGPLARIAGRRNADRVVAVDIDDDHLDAARRRGGAVEYRWADLEVDLPGGRFDHVVCHNLLHRVRNPIAVLDRLIERTGSSLIMDVTGPVAERPARLLRRDFGATPAQRAWVAEAPLAVVGRNGTPGRKREQKFFFSPVAMRHLLLEQRRHFSGLTLASTGIEGRYALRADRRRIGRLVVVSGPTGAGKSTLLELIRSGRDRHRWAAIDPGGTAGRPVSNSDGLAGLPGHLPGLLFHYDLLRPWRRDAAVHDRDEGLHVVDCSERVEVIVLVADADVLSQRLRQELAGVGDPRSRQARRLREVLDLYRHPTRLVDQIDRWRRFCHRRGAHLSFVDSGRGYRPVPSDRWAAVITGSGGR